MFLTNLSFTKFIPKSILKKTNIVATSIDEFMQFAAKKIKSENKLLDAGAGSCPYKKHFAHTKYESTDFDDIFDKSSKNKHDFICSLDKIPKPNNSYNAIISTEVLEHVEYPQKVINEFYRVLKSRGQLFLTTPEAWGVHGEPYHFFNFTKYGLKSLFINAGFKIIFIKPRGGIFWYLGLIIKDLPDYLSYQYLKPKNKTFTTYLYFIFYLISLPFCVYLVPLLFYYLDKVDKKQDFTIGYSCYCVKQ
jgi:SAM-dependent methyltransferase